MINKTIFNTEVSFLNKVTDKTAHPCGLSDLLLGERFKDIVEAVRNEQDPAKQEELKKKLPCFTPSGLFGNPVNSKNLQEHSGFICIDLDAKDNKEARGFANLKDIIHKVPYVQYCGLSVRGNGFFCLIPIKDPAKHKRYFKALQIEFKKCGLTIDSSCSDVCRKRFVSYDPDPYIYTGAKVWDLAVSEYDEKERRVTNMTITEKKKEVEKLLNTLDEGKIDITGNYQTWINILCGIAKDFGEDGRDYAHRVSQHYDGYSHEETDAKYTDLLSHTEYKYTIATLFHYANKALNNAEYDFKDVPTYDEDEDL